MERVDAFLISLFERFAHWTQREFGMTAVHLARGCYCVAILFRIFGRMVRDWGKWGTVAWDGFIVFWLALRLLEVSEPASSSGSVMNPEKCRHQVGRILCVVLVVIFWPLDWPRDMWFECVVLAMYFQACDVLPPSASRVRQFLRSLGGLRPAVDAA
jgi:hypothetical protein